MEKWVAIVEAFTSKDRKDTKGNLKQLFDSALVDPNNKWRHYVPKKGQTGLRPGFDNRSRINADTVRCAATLPNPTKRKGRGHQSRR